MEKIQLNIKSFKRKMLLWAHQWTQDNADTNKAMKTVSKLTPDAMDISRLLQAMGYRLRCIDRLSPSELSPVTGVPPGQPCCRVVIMCPHSGLRMHMDAATPTCGCPPPEAEKGISWEVSGHAPTGEVEDMGNSLVPELDRELSRGVSEIIQEVLRLTRPVADMNDNTVSVADSTIPSGGQEKQVSSASRIGLFTPKTKPASNVPKDSMEQSNILHSRYRSLDTLMSAGADNDDLPEPGQLTPKNDAAVEAADDDETTPKASFSYGKKYISRSSPTVHLEASPLVRSDTFVYKDDAKRTGQSETPGTKKILVRKKNEELDSKSSKPSPLLRKLCEAQRIINDAISMVSDSDSPQRRISDVSKTGAAQVRTVRTNPKCSTTYGSRPTLSRAATTVQRSGIIVQPKIYRSATNLAPESKSPSSAARAKSASTNALLPGGSRGNSSSLAKATKSPVPGAAAATTRRFAPNPKYAHVQSKIPKPGCVLKKGD